MVEKQGKSLFSIIKPLFNIRTKNLVCIMKRLHLVMHSNLDLIQGVLSVSQWHVQFKAHIFVCSKAAAKFGDVTGVNADNSSLVVAPEKPFIAVRFP